ncbi:transposase zinc-binding domain-containing protein [Providencia hangzhouensis]
MYIPRPTKLLFQYDDGWNRFIDNNTVDEWQLISVEKMLACSTCAMGVRRYCCSSPECTHSRFFCQTCKSKACSACGLKGTEQWIAQQRHILPDCEWQHITLTMPHLLWPFFNNNWALLNQLFAAPLVPCSNTPSALASKLVFFCATYLWSPTQSTSTHSFIGDTRRTHKI